jgi:5'-nucleotidase/UDP-sugar diphosphatase
MSVPNSLRKFVRIWALKTFFCSILVISCLVRSILHLRFQWAWPRASIESQNRPIFLGGDFPSFALGPHFCPMGPHHGLLTVVVCVQSRLSNLILLPPTTETHKIIGTLFFHKYKHEMISSYMSNLGYNATGVGPRDFDGGPTEFQAMVNEMKLHGVSTVVVNMQYTGSDYASVLTSQTFTIGGASVLVLGLTNIQIASLVKLPNDITVMTSDETRTALIAEIGLANSDIVLLLSKQTSFDEDRQFLVSSGLNAFVDVVLSSYSSEMMFSGSNATSVSGGGCAPGLRLCSIQYPFNSTVGSGSNQRPYLIAAAAPQGMGMGYLNVSFDDSGVLTAWSGKSILFNRTIYRPDTAIEVDLYNRKQEVIAFTQTVVGTTPVFLVGDGSNARAPCRWKQCSGASLVADALRNLSADIDIGIVNGGTCSANITDGDITFGDILTTLPFLNTVATYSVTGETLLKMLNHGLRNMFISGSGRFLQVSGLQYQFNPNLPATANRVITVSVRDRATGVYQPLDTLKTYRIASPNFMFNGGDGFNTVGLPSDAINTLPYGPSLTDTVIAFINAKVADGDSSYFTSLTTEQRLIITDLVEAFVPTTTPVVIVHKSIPDALSAAFTVITGVISIFTIIIGSYIWYHRKHAVTVIASAVFCIIILGGVLLSQLAIQIFIHVRNDAGCMVFPWLGNYAFVIIFGALFAKTWRMDMIFARTKKLRTKKRAISNFLLFIVIGLMLLIETFIMGLWQGLSPLKYKFTIDDGRQSRYSCSSKNGVYFFAASIAYKGLLMLWGMYLVVKTRNIDSDFRESTFIGWVIYAVFFTMAVIVTICLILRTNVVGVFVLICIGFWIVAFSVLGAVFIPKIIEIFSHPDLVWATYFQKRAENLRQGTGSVFAKNQSVAHDSIQDRMDGMSLVGLQSLLEEYEMRETSLKSSVTEIGKDLTAIRTKIAKKQGSGPSRRDLGGPKKYGKP